MKIGCCGGDTYFWNLAEETGFDYIEVPIAFVVNDAGGFAALKKFLQKSSIKVEASNCFLPSTLKVVGPDADLKKLNEYADSVFAKVKECGCEIVVFGSGGSRTPVKGFPMNKAVSQIKDFLSSVSEYADKYNIVVVIEPLNHNQTPLINTVQMARDICESVNKKSVKYLADLFQMTMEKDSFENLSSAKDLYHTHIPFPEERFNTEEFINNLKKLGYNRRISLEDNGGIISKTLDSKGNMKMLFENTLKQIKNLTI